MMMKKLNCFMLVFAFLVASTLVYGTKVLADINPIAEWKIEEGTGTTVGDSSGYGKTGAITNATWVDGLLGEALSFAGSTDYVVAQPSIAGKTNWTIEAWVKPVNSVGESYIYFERNPDPNFYVSITEDNKIKVGTLHIDRTGGWDEYETEKSNVITRNMWNYVVVTLENGGIAADSGTVKCYVNGINVGTGSLGMSALGPVYSYWIDNEANNVWIKVPYLSGGEEKEFCVYKDAGSTLVPADWMFMFHDNFESGVVDVSKWDLKAEAAAGTVGLRSDSVYGGSYCVGGDSPVYKGIGEGVIPDQIHYFAKIPIGDIAVGEKIRWTSRTKRWKNTRYSGSTVTFGTGGSNEIFGIPCDGGYHRYNILITRKSNDLWEYRYSIDGGEYGAPIEITQTFTDYFQFGIQGRYRYAEDNSDFTRTDNVYFIRRAASVEPTVTRIGGTDSYGKFSIKNNLDTELSDYCIRIPATEIGGLESNQDKLNIY